VRRVSEGVYAAMSNSLVAQQGGERFLLADASIRGGK